MEEVEFMEIAAGCGLPAPGMVLADESVHEMVDHCRGVFQKRAKKLKIHIPDSGTVVPLFLKGSILYWRPVLSMVSTFPIDEEYAFDDLEFGNIDPKRALFYCELRGSGLKDLMKRYALSKIKYKKTESDASPKKPNRSPERKGGPQPSQE